MVGSRCARAVGVVEFSAILDTIQRAVTEFDHLNVVELLDALIRNVVELLDALIREVIAVRQEQHYHGRLATRPGGSFAHGARQSYSPLGGFQIICVEGPFRTWRAPLAGREGARIAFKAFHLVHCTAGQTCDGKKRLIVWYCEYPLTLLCFEVRNIPFISGS